MRTTPISQKEQKRMAIIGLVLDIGQGILTIPVATEIINEILDIFIYIFFLGYMLAKKIQTPRKIMLLTLIFGAEEIPVVDLFWFWRNFAANTLYEGVPGNEGVDGQMMSLGKAVGQKPPLLPQQSAGRRPPPLNGTPGVRLPRK
jgi:hypothetical protein